MFRTNTKYFYILLVCSAVLLGLVFPLWFIFSQSLDVVLVFDRWGIPWVAGIVFYAATAAAASIATLLFVHACAHLEVKEAQPE